MDRDITKIAPKKLTIREEGKLLTDAAVPIFTELMGQAGDVPSWFSRKRWTDTSMRPDPKKAGWMTSKPKECRESNLDYLIRWRISYATAAYRAITDDNLLKELQTPISADKS